MTDIGHDSDGGKVMKREYRIGEVANLLGVTQDTLRFYEEKDIIKPYKAENGYRCYTADDVWLLLDAIYYRKVNFSVSDVKQILYHNSCEAMQDLIKDKIEEEKRSIKEHQYFLTKLEVSHKSCRNVKSYLDVCAVLPFPRFYILSEKREEKSEVRDDWFQMIKEKSLYEVSNIMEEYHLDRGYEKPVYSYLSLRESIVRKMKMKKRMQSVPYLEHEKCVFTVDASENRSPRKEAIERAVAWAEKNGHELVGKVYSQYTINCCLNGKMAYYIEIYLPVREGNSETESCNIT